ncbi:hypothetical protein NA56DRAFT_695824 [Hyaloscypha hepaticicola]|uniref:Uncharacterized protein n=1 Tax=Hyaloscypha hepaticicola TaxID=2082293 RepID=A0A2J6PD35_9HELO|nr:hypothetical protein NA56DRAFT_695824 [Hyaloscypha hepaticicola]
MPSSPKQTDYHSSSSRSRQKYASDLTSSKALKYSLSSANEPNFLELAIWEKVASKIKYANAMILIVSDTHEKKSLKKFLTKNQDLRKIEIEGYDTDMFKRNSTSTVMLATPDELQHALELASKLKIKSTTQSTSAPSGWRFWESKYPQESQTESIIPETLFIVVSRSIKEIAYSISNRIKEVTIMQSNPTEDANDRYSLCINKSSTYCDIETWRWDARENWRNRSITHEAGMYWDISSLSRQGLDFNNSIISAMTPEMSEQVQKNFQGFVEEDDDDQSSGGSTSRRPSAPTHIDNKVSWFERWLKLIAGAVGAAVGVTGAAASFSFCWFNAGGFFVKGSLGLYLSGGYFNMGALGGACLWGAAGGLAAGIAAGVAVYYIPWGTIWNFVKWILKAVWNKIKEAAFWIWEKLKTLVSDVALALKQGLTGNAFPHMEKPARFTA